MQLELGQVAPGARRPTNLVSEGACRALAAWPVNHRPDRPASAQVTEDEKLVQLSLSPLSIERAAHESHRLMLSTGGATGKAFGGKIAGGGRLSCIRSHARPL